jgi:4-amino-4-deoxy-L-arabinose transferase-like glycosyltransferase
MSGQACFRFPAAGSCRPQLVLIAILALAAGLRVAGLGFGLPLELRPDEQYFQEVVARMAATGDLNPHRFNYGGPLFHLVFFATRLVHAVLAAFDPGGAGTFAEFAARTVPVALIQRSLSALFGIATVLLTWHTGRRLGSDPAACAAAFLLAVLFLPVRDAHFGTVDVCAAFVSTAAITLLVRAAQSGRRADFALAGAAAGIATAVRYVPMVLAVPLAFVAWGAERAAGRGLVRAAVGPRVLLGGAAMIAGAVLSGPYMVLAFDEFRAGFADVFFAGGQTHFTPAARFREIALTWLVQAADGPFVAVAALAAALALVSRSSAARAIALFVVLYVAALCAGTLFFMRWLNPVLPSLCMLIGWLVAGVVRRRRHAAAWSAVIAVAIGALPAARAIGIDRLFVRETTLEQAVRFLADRVPAGIPVACPNPDVARILTSSRPLAVWDPLALAASPEWYAVVPRHPLPWIGQDPGFVSVVAAAAGDVEPVATFRAFRPSRERDATFEDADFFLYPLRGFDALEAAGPDIEILRVRSRPDRAAGPQGPPPPVISVRASPASIHVSFEPPPGVDVLGYYVRFASETDVQNGVFAGPFAFGPDPRDLPFTKAIRGRYVIQTATVARSGIGRWSEPVPVVID